MASQKVIAVHLDLTAARVSELMAEGRLTRGGDLDTVRVEYIRTLRAASRGNNTGGDLQQERTRLTRHQANLASIDEEIKKRNLIAAEEVLGEWMSMTLAMKAKLLGLGKKVASTALGVSDYTEMEKVVDTYVKESLSELSANAETP